MTYTLIRCTTCTSTVPWGPHCPECGAYLEFAGDPPWRPAPEGLPASAAPDPIIFGDREGGGTVAVEVEPSRDPSPTPDIISVRTSGGPTPTFSPPAEPRRGSFVGTLSVLAAGVLVSWLIWLVVGPVLGIATAVVFVVWALVLWPRRIDAATTEPGPEATLEVLEVSRVAAIQEVDELPEIQARPPQSLARRTVEATRPLAAPKPEGDVPCLACTRLNVVGRSYCVWCGMPMTDAMLAPNTIPVIESTAPDAGQNRQQRGRRRGPSRSWYAPLLVITLVGVLVTSIIVTVFGPGAFRVRFGMTSVYQLINQFIDPYAGRSALIDTATATTSLRGTRPEDAIGGDATTFWASQPSADQGAGSALVFTFSGETTINRMVIFPGIQNRILDNQAVATPRTITLTFDDGSTVTEELEPLESESDLQQLVRFPKKTTRTVRLTINTVYPPRATEPGTPTEVAISGVQFLMPPDPPTVLNLPTDIQPRTSLPGTVS